VRSPVTPFNTTLKQVGRWSDDEVPFLTNAAARLPFPRPRPPPAGSSGCRGTPRGPARALRHGADEDAIALGLKYAADLARTSPIRRLVLTQGVDGISNTVHRVGISNTVHPLSLPARRHRGSPERRRFAEVPPSISCASASS